MNVQEVTQLLARIQVLDNRQVDALTIEAWSPLMAGVDYRDAVEAVNTHFRTSTNYLQPAHVVAGARVVRAGRPHEIAAGHVHRWVVDGTCADPACGARRVS